MFACLDKFDGLEGHRSFKHSIYAGFLIHWKKCDGGKSKGGMWGEPHQNPQSWWGNSSGLRVSCLQFVSWHVLVLDKSMQLPSFCPLIYKMNEYLTFPHLL